MGCLVRTLLTAALTCALTAGRAVGAAFARTRFLRDWATENRYGNVTTAQFIALAERDSGQELDRFFDAWLYQLGKPTEW